MRRRFCAATLEPPERQPVGIHHPIDVMAQQLRDILRVVAQWRGPHNQHVEMREQVAAKALGPRPVLDARLRGGQHPAAKLELLGTTEPRKAARLEHADDEPLHGRRQVFYLVNEQGAVGNFLQHTRTGRAALLPTKQPVLGIGFPQAAGNQCYEGRGGPRAALVEVTREGLATGAGLAYQEHGRGISRDLLQLRAQLLHDLALADGRQQLWREHLARAAPPLAGIQRPLHRAQQLRE